jgi:serine/threonine protein kinase
VISKGDVLAGRYRVGDLIGSSGTAIIVAGHDLWLDARVDVEICDPEHFGSAERVARSIGQRRAARRLRSEHVLHILDVGMDRGVLFTVLEPVPGSDLGQWLKLRGALPVEQAIDFLIQACDALAEAHSLGIVHRDIKPRNLVAAELPGVAPSIKVGRWDLSLSSSSAPSPGEGEMVGTLIYMPPESLRGMSDHDERRDIWSLGVTLCELLTGRMPVDGGPHEVVRLVASDAPLPFPGAFSGLPQGLQAVIRKCLEKDRRHRFQSTADLAVALGEFGPERSRPLIDRIRAYPQKGIGT